MSLKYILERVESNVGINDPTLNPQQRILILNVINEAAREIYRTTDLPGCLKEVDIQVQSNLTMALPAFVGSVRAIKINTNWNWIGYRYSLQGIQSRYSTVQWSRLWNKFTVIGESPIANELLTQLPLRFKYPIIDETLIVTTIGETAKSNRAIDNTPIVAIELNGSKNFINISSIKKNKITDYNLTILDGNENELAVIYADQLDSLYTLIDISKYPDLNQLGQCCVGDTPKGYMATILFKPRLNILQNDEDEFPVKGFDDIIVMRAKQLLAEDTDANLALGLYQKSMSQLKSEIEDKTGTYQAKLSVSPNPIYKLNRLFWAPNRNHWRRTY